MIETTSWKRNRHFCTGRLHRVHFETVFGSHCILVALKSFKVPSYHCYVESIVTYVIEYPVNSGAWLCVDICRECRTLGIHARSVVQVSNIRSGATGTAAIIETTVFVAVVIKQYFCYVKFDC